MAKRKLIAERDAGLVLYQWINQHENDEIMYSEYEIIDGSGREPLAKFDEDELDMAYSWIEGYEQAVEDKEEGEW